MSREIKDSTLINMVFLYFRSNPSQLFLFHYQEVEKEDEIEFFYHNEIICYNCNKLGHKERDCKQQWTIPKLIICYHCENIGHKAINCPQLFEQIYYDISDNDSVSISDSLLYS